MEPGEGGECRAGSRGRTKLRVRSAVSSSSQQRHGQMALGAWSRDSSFHMAWESLENPNLTPVPQDVP